METLATLWGAIGHISTALVVVGVLVTCYFTIKGFMPVLIRLGLSLWRRKVAVFASGDTLASLGTLLTDTTLISSKNLIEIATPNDLGRADRASLFLVYWPDWSDNIADILARKKDNTGLIIYAPQAHGLVPADIIKELETHRNVVLNNFRGRLLNDVLVSMITTGYEKS